MALLLLHTLILFGLTRAFNLDAFLVNAELCIINEDPNSSIPFVECMCSNRENITYSSMLVYNINRITIKGCGTVHLGFDAFSNLYLKELEFMDIQSLEFGPFTLSLAQEIEVLKIRHIGNLVIKKHAFVGLRNVDTLVISNVTLDTLSKEAISSISDIRFILVEDSIFNYVEQLAFAVHNVTILKISNSEFRLLENCSFYIMLSEEVRFEDCIFENTDNGTFILSHVDSFYFQNCRFGNLASNSIQSNDIKLFNLSDSVIEELQPNAFSDLKVIEKIVFKRNTIRIVYDESLHPIITPTLDYADVDFCCNRFTCDCNIYWMWDLQKRGESNSFLESNTCIEDPSRNLSLYVPIMDSSNNCMTLELKSSQILRNSSYKPMVNYMDIAASRASHLHFVIFIITTGWIFSTTSVVLSNSFFS